MAKGPVVFIILLIVTIFISGCSSVEPKIVEPVSVEPAESKPDMIPLKTEPNEVAPVVIEPKDVEPVRTEPVEKKSISATYFHDKFAGIFEEFVNDYGMADYQGLRRRRLELRTLLQEVDKLKREEY